MSSSPEQHPSTDDPFEKLRSCAKVCECESSDGISLSSGSSSRRPIRGNSGCSDCGQDWGLASSGSDDGYRSSPARMKED